MNPTVAFSPFTAAYTIGLAKRSKQGYYKKESIFYLSS